MNEQEKFDRAVAVLVKAYFDDTLEYGSCTRCAVGNLVGAIAYPGSQDAIGKGKGAFFLMPDGELKRTSWYTFLRLDGAAAAWYSPLDERVIAEEQRTALGYTWEQISKIEEAFENSRYYNRTELHENFNDNAMYDGMMAVVTELAIIHGIDLTHTVKAQKLFKSTYSA